MATIGLCMIVKNERAVIERCLTSVLSLIDYVSIVDTGSTDGTQDIIRAFIDRHGLRGQVIDEPWRDFAYNRTFALTALRDVADVDYAFMIDADDLLVCPDDFDAAEFKAQLRHDIYDVTIANAELRYQRPQISSNKRAFKYSGVLHEFLDVADETSRSLVPDISIMRGLGGGARSQNPRKYEDDAIVLERALMTETDPYLRARYTFYLGQSYRDCEHWEQALAAYLRRAELGQWSEEVFVSLFEAGKLMDRLDYRDTEIIGTYLKAYAKLPRRVETVHAAMAYCNARKMYALSYLIGKNLTAIPVPETGLFLQPWIYDYGLLDELAVAAYWSGHHQDSLDACIRLLGDSKLPEAYRKRIASNADHAAKKLAAPKR